MMNKATSQEKSSRGGIGRMLKEQKSRLYIIRRCVAMLLCHRRLITAFCSRQRVHFLFWFLAPEYRISNSLVCILSLGSFDVHVVGCYLSCFLSPFNTKCFLTFLVGSEIPVVYLNDHSKEQMQSSLTEQAFGIPSMLH